MSGVMKPVRNPDVAPVQGGSSLEPMRQPNRRLCDKVLEAVERAVEQGRREIAERLTRIYEAVVEEDARHNCWRRDGDLPSLDPPPPKLPHRG